MITGSLITCILVFSSDAWSSGSQQVEIKGTVKRVRGVVFLNGKRVEPMAKVSEGDELKTEGKGSFVEIEFGQGSVVRMKEGKVKLTSFTKKETMFSLIKGTLFSFIKGLEDKERFKVRTKYSSLGVRGTKFMIAHDKDTYVCVCEGIVETKDKNKKKTSLIAGEDLHIDAKGSKNKTKASDDMMSMAKDAFFDMGFPVKGI